MADFLCDIWPSNDAGVLDMVEVWLGGVASWCDELFGRFL